MWCHARLCKTILLSLKTFRPLYLRFFSVSEKFGRLSLNSLFHYPIEPFLFFEIPFCHGPALAAKFVLFWIWLQLIIITSSRCFVCFT